MSPWLHRIDPIAFQFPEIPVFGLTLHPAVHWYGVMYLLGFGLAWWLGRLRVRQGRLPGVDEQAFGDLVFYGMLGVILGGRLGYILFYDLSAYLADPLQVFEIWNGGMSFHGGLIGVCVAAWWWATKSATSMKCSRCLRAHIHAAMQTPTRPPWKLMPPFQISNTCSGSAR